MKFFNVGNFQTPDSCPPIPSDWFNVDAEDFKKTYELTFDTMSEGAKCQIGRLAVSGCEFVNRYFSEIEVQTAISLFEAKQQ